MSNLLPWLTKRRERFYTGEALQANIASFLAMVAAGATVHESKDAVIVLEDYGLKGNVRAWLLFGTFSRGVVRDMAKVSSEFTGDALYASTHDPRIKTILMRMGFTQYMQDRTDFWLVKQGEHYGL